MAGITRRSVNLTGLAKLEVAPGVFVYISDPTMKIRLTWNTGDGSDQTWTNIVVSGGPAPVVTP
tara:strand:+ start:127 stop:318 length:192 start_codon:yes stop_codon:yes gene_type:complete